MQPTPSLQSEFETMGYEWNMVDTGKSYVILCQRKTCILVISHE